MSLETPGFFSSAWNPEQNDFSLTEAYQPITEDHTDYTPLFLQGQSENNQLDYLSGQSGYQHSSQSTYMPRHELGVLQSHDDLDRILGAFGSTFLDKNIDTAHVEGMPNSSCQNRQIHGLASYDCSLYSPSDLGAPSLRSWSSDVKPNAAPTQIMTQMANDTRRTSMRFGQITPIDSPVDGFLPPEQQTVVQPTSKSKSDHTAAANDAPKVRRPRKSRKKSMTKEQEEAKRQKFLERNRVAADKCRQNKKKWIDDLQTKAQHFNTDNTAKKVQLEELENEIEQIRSLLFIHSRSCSEKDIMDWINQEANKVQLVGERGLKRPGENGLARLSQNYGEMPLPTSRPASSNGYSSVNEAITHQYSAGTTDDDFLSTLSGDLSGQSSRRPSTAQIWDGMVLPGQATLNASPYVRE